MSQISHCDILSIALFSGQTIRNMSGLVKTNPLKEQKAPPQPLCIATLSNLTAFVIIAQHFRAGFLFAFGRCEKTFTFSTAAACVYVRDHCNGDLP